MKSYAKRKKIKLKGTPWKVRRQECFDRDNNKCQYCGKFFLHLAPHHRVYKSQGGDDRLDNLASICVNCHYDHGALKGLKLLKEPDQSKIDELIRFYRH